MRSLAGSATAVCACSMREFYNAMGTVGSALARIACKARTNVVYARKRVTEGCQWGRATSEG